MSYPIIYLLLARLRQEDLLREAAAERRAALFPSPDHWSSIRPILNRLAARRRLSMDQARLISSRRNELGTTAAA